MPSYSVPTELYREILQHVDSKRDLCTLSITSRAIQADAEYFIYQVVDSKSQVDTDYICRLVTRCPRIGPLIRSLRISSAGKGRHLSPPAEFCERLALALQHLPNLEVLKFSECLEFPEQPYGWIFSKCTFSLRELDCHFAMDPAFIAFLRTQRKLMHFGWEQVFPNPDPTADFPRDPQFLPSLCVLSTNSPSLALHVVPRHPITHLWISGLFAPSEDWEAFDPHCGFFTPNLHSLRLNFPYSKHGVIAVLSALSEQAPDLRSLGFLPYISAQETELISVVSRFKCLISLVIWSVISAETSRALAEACPSLRLIASLRYSYSRKYVFMPVNPLGVPRPVHDPDYLLWKDA